MQVKGPENAPSHETTEQYKKLPKNLSQRRKKGSADPEFPKDKGPSLRQPRDLLCRRDQ